MTGLSQDEMDELRGWKKDSDMTDAKPATDAEIARLSILASDFDDGDFTGKPILQLIARIDAERARVKALEDAGRALLARWNLFTGPERSGWGNQEQAYYDLAKHAQAEWKALRAALTGGTDAG